MSAMKYVCAAEPPAEQSDPDGCGYDALMTPALQRCMDSLSRDLPRLLVEHPRRWVAYVDGELLRVADTQTELYLQCLDELGLPHDQFIVAGIGPDCGGEVEYLPR